MRHFSTFRIFILLALVHQGCSGNIFLSQKALFERVNQYERADFEIVINKIYENAFNQDEVMLDMVIVSPSGEHLVLPCYFAPKFSDSNEFTVFRARFTPSESGNYSYFFRLIEGDYLEQSVQQSFAVTENIVDGFLHANNYWTLKFDSGKPFRGIGENVAWEPSKKDNPKYSYDYLLPKLSKSGANFIRTWMCSWNLPLEWELSGQSGRDLDYYFNPDAIERIDDLLDMCDSLDLYLMLAMDYHGALIPSSEWGKNRYNKINGGPAETPADFFTDPEAKLMSKNKLRYLVARWGYSTHLAAWEFFNEIDNVAYSQINQDSTIIEHGKITEWHKEMANYIKDIDPYEHITTTSVSHRGIDGLFELDNLDIVQRHIYKQTDQIPAGVFEYTEKYKKPFVWGEFGYEWDWNLDFTAITDELTYDYKRGLWYGMFHPTPILPMSWWWEFFDDQDMTSYFRGVRIINDMMLASGGGDFQKIDIQADGIESYAVRCGDIYYAVLLNSTESDLYSQVFINLPEGRYKYQYFDPNDVSFSESLPMKDNIVPDFLLEGKDELVIVLQPQK